MKRFETAKTRLGDSAADRQRLARAFALDTLAACRETRGVQEVIVVSKDRLVPRGSSGVRWVHDPGGGINAALTAGHLATGGHLPTLALLADLPSIRSFEIELLLRLATWYPRSFLSDLAGTGSTALMSARCSELDPRFGPRSRAAHRTSGAVELQHPELVRARRDVDTSVDLADAIRLGVGPHSQSVVRNL